MAALVRVNQLCHGRVITGENAVLSGRPWVEKCDGFLQRLHAAAMLLESRQARNLAAASEDGDIFAGQSRAIHLSGCLRRPSHLCLGSVSDSQHGLGSHSQPSFPHHVARATT
jgi:hypothetical protein